MEKKNSNLSIVFLVIAISIIIMMGALLYMQKTEADRQIAELENNASQMQETINNLQGKIENTSSENSLESKYSEITKKLENEEIFLLTDTIKNNDGTYTLKGKIITEDTSREPIAEYPFYKETGEYRQITLSANTKCEYALYGYEEYKTDTVENVFSKKLYLGWGQGPCFNFTFVNGKCVSVNEVPTGQ